MPKFNRKIEEVNGVLYETWTNRSGSETTISYLDDCNEYSSNSGCDACGNPAYPACKSSCPLFDD